MRGENYFGIWLVRRCGIDVKTVAFHRNSPGLVADAAELSVEIVSDRGFIAGDGFDVDELASERDGVHGGENSRPNPPEKLEVRSQNAEVSHGLDTHSWANLTFAF